MRHTPVVVIPSQVDHAECRQAAPSTGVVICDPQSAAGERFGAGVVASVVGRLGGGAEHQAGARTGRYHGIVGQLRRPLADLHQVPVSDDIVQ